MLLFVGSVALKNYVPERTTKDIDLIAPFEAGIKYLKEKGCTKIWPTNEGKKIIGKSDNGMIELEVAWPNSTAEALLKLVWDRSQACTWDIHGTARYAPLEALYALKMSHRYRKNSPHFRKTMSDIHLMRLFGLTVIPHYLNEWFLWRQKETYTYAHPKLNVGKSDFFAGDGIDYVYDHDSIHEAVKLGATPAYNFFKPDASEVFCSKAMFDECSEATRLASVYEESSVLAIERSIVPHPGVLTPDSAFGKALDKVCSSITSGWWREYAWENHAQALALFETLKTEGRDFLTLFNTGLKNGVVKPFKGELA